MGSPAIRFKNLRMAFLSARREFASRNSNRLPPEKPWVLAIGFTITGNQQNHFQKTLMRLAKAHGLNPGKVSAEVEKIERANGSHEFRAAVFVKRRSTKQHGSRYSHSIHQAFYSAAKDAISGNGAGRDKVRDYIKREARARRRLASRTYADMAGTTLAY